MKEPKVISAALARTSAMLAGKTTPELATMLHERAPDHPYLARQLSWVVNPWHKSARGCLEVCRLRGGKN
jgi:hypothetical protein